MVTKLEKKRRRLMLEMMSAGQPVIATVKVKTLADRPRTNRHHGVVETIPLPELDAFFRPAPKEIEHKPVSDVTDVPVTELPIPDILKRDPTERPRGHFDLTKPETFGKAIREASIDARTKKRLEKNDLKRRPKSRLIQKALDARDKLEKK